MIRLNPRLIQSTDRSRDACLQTDQAGAVLQPASDTHGALQQSLTSHTNIVYKVRALCTMDTTPPQLDPLFPWPDNMHDVPLSNCHVPMLTAVPKQATRHRHCTTARFPFRNISNNLFVSILTLNLSLNTSNFVPSVVSHCFPDVVSGFVGMVSGRAVQI